MNKAELRALEKVFEAEINGALPFQTKSKVFRKLCDDGYLSEMNCKLSDGRFSVTIAGYELTHLGRLTYCESCSDYNC